MIRLVGAASTGGAVLIAAGGAPPDWPMLALAVTVLAVGELDLATVRVSRQRHRIGLYEAALVVGLALASGPMLVPAAVVAVAVVAVAGVVTGVVARAVAYTPSRQHRAPKGTGTTGIRQSSCAAGLAAGSAGLAVFVSTAARAAVPSGSRWAATVEVAALAAGALAGGTLRSLGLAALAALAGVRGGRGRFGPGSQGHSGRPGRPGRPLFVGARLRAMALLANTGLGVAVVVLAARSPLTLLLTPAVAAGLVMVYRIRAQAAEDRQGWLLVDRLGDELAGLDEPDVVDLVQRRAAALFQAEAATLHLVPTQPTAADRSRHAHTVDATTVDETVCWAADMLGRLTVAFDPPTAWDPADAIRLRAVAHAAAAALAHARLRERSRGQAEIAAYAAEHDALTGLGNRCLLVSRAADLLGSDPDGCVGLLLLDLDRFKEVNDALGHSTGDILLRAVAETLRRGVREGDVVARVGGDEFAVLVTGIAGPAQAEAVAAELADLLCRPVEVDGTSLAVEVSVGVACHPDDGGNIDELLQHADIAMYQAKQSHPRWRRYVPDDRATRLERLELVAELRSAISGGELVLNYQPQLELRTGQVKAVEALVRWNHPRRGLLTPTTFVPAVEQSGLIQPFTFAVLDQALKACAGWRGAGYDVAVSVNLSAKNLMNTELPGEVAKLLVMRGVPASSLTLEITETARMADVASALRLLRELQELGVRVAADDFGTGYSSMALIQERVLDEVKIDRSFVRRLLVEQGDAAIVAATVQLAHAHGLMVVAEGVESAELLDALAGLHCDQVQGLHVGPAMPLADLTSWLGGAARVPRRAVGDTVRIFPGPHRRPPAAL